MLDHPFEDDGTVYDRLCPFISALDDCIVLCSGGCDDSATTAVPEPFASFELALEGPSNTTEFGQRFSTVYAPSQLAARLFVATGDLESCLTQCLATPMCLGVFHTAASAGSRCYGLDNLGSPALTAVPSQSWRRITSQQVVETTTTASDSLDLTDSTTAALSSTVEDILGSGGEFDLTTEATTWSLLDPPFVVNTRLYDHRCPLTAKNPETCIAICPRQCNPSTTTAVTTTTEAVSGPLSSFSLALQGSASGEIFGQRFSSALQPVHQLFTTRKGMEICLARCLKLPVCLGVFMMENGEKKCHGLDYLGSSVPTAIPSSSWLRVNFTSTSTMTTSAAYPSSSTEGSEGCADQDVCSYFKAMASFPCGVVFDNVVLAERCPGSCDTRCYCPVPAGCDACAPENRVVLVDIKGCESCECIAGASEVQRGDAQLGVGDADTPGDSSDFILPVVLSVAAAVVVAVGAGKMCLRICH